MVMEFIRGQRLQTRKFLHATYFQRRNIYIDLINILAQLRQLEFPAVVSLTPNPDNPDDETHPAIGPLHSMPINKFERKSREPLSSTVSAKSFIDLHCHILPETYQLPVEELEHGQAKKEIFALHSVLKGIEKYTAPAESEGTLILAHPDLRCCNIIINDDFHILGIIDWEFAVTVPAKLFVPPLFTTGHYPKLLLIGTRTPRDRILQEFRAVLEEMHATSAGWTRLWQDWEFEHKDDTPDNVSLPVLSPLLEVLRHPSKLTHVYYLFIFHRLYGSEANKDAVDELFKSNEHFSKQVELRGKRSERYKEYLRSRGSSDPDEKFQKVREWVEKTKAVLQASQASHDGK